MNQLAWRTVIADDERLARRGLRRIVEVDPDVMVVGECRNGRELMDVLQGDPPDLMFLDIQMPFADGLRCLRSVAPERRPVTVIVSAHPQHALGAYEAHVLDYLLKPFSDARVVDSLTRAKRQLTSRQTANPPAARLGVRTERGLRIIAVNDVDWIEASDDESTLHMRGATLHVREPLTSLATRLDATRFVRVHRSAIVNLDRVVEVQSYFHGRHVLLLAGGATVILARRRREAFEQALGQPL